MWKIIYGVHVNYTHTAKRSPPPLNSDMTACDLLLRGLDENNICLSKLKTS
jgi:hypothetical protein